MWQTRLNQNYLDDIEKRLYTADIDELHQWIVKLLAAHNTLVHDMSDSTVARVAKQRDEAIEQAAKYQKLAISRGWKIQSLMSPARVDMDGNEFAHREVDIADVIGRTM